MMDNELANLLSDLEEVSEEEDTTEPSEEIEHCMWSFGDNKKNRNKWTIIEIENFEIALQKFGKKWTLISEFLKGDNQKGRTPKTSQRLLLQKI